MLLGARSRVGLGPAWPRSIDSQAGPTAVQVRGQGQAQYSIQRTKDYGVLVGQILESASKSAAVSSFPMLEINKWGSALSTVLVRSTVRM